MMSRQRKSMSSFVMDTSYFDGSSSWFEFYDQFKFGKNWEQITKLLYLESFLKGPALWYFSKLKRLGNDYDQIVKLMSIQYSKTDHYSNYHSSYDTQSVSEDWFVTNQPCFGGYERHSREWHTFERHFNVYAASRKWKTDERLFNLLQCLRGRALDYFMKLSFRSSGYYNFIRSWTP